MPAVIPVVLECGDPNHELQKLKKFLFP